MILDIKVSQKLGNQRWKILLVAFLTFSLVHAELVENVNSFCKREGVVFQIQKVSKNYGLSNYLDLSKISSNIFWIE